MTYYDFLHKKTALKSCLSTALKAVISTFFPKSKEYKFYANFEKSQISVAKPS